MDKLETFQRNDPRKLFELANQLNERLFFAIFLNETQFKIINHILSLDNFEIWTNFWKVIVIFPICNPKIRMTNLRLQTPMRTTRVLVVREFRTIVVIEIPQLSITMIKE